MLQYLSGELIEWAYMTSCFNTIVQPANNEVIGNEAPKSPRSSDLTPFNYFSLFPNHLETIPDIKDQIFVKFDCDKILLKIHS